MLTYGVVWGLGQVFVCGGSPWRDVGWLVTDSDEPGKLLAEAFWMDNLHAVYFDQWNPLSSDGASLRRSNNILSSLESSGV